MDEVNSYASFLIRLWQEEKAAEPAGTQATWHGEIESIQSGERWPFQGLDLLPDLLEEYLAGVRREQYDQSRSQHDDKQAGGDGL